MRNTRFIWFLLTIAFVILSYVTDFEDSGPRRPNPQKQVQPETREKFDTRNGGAGPVQRWLLQADTDRVRSTGTAFAIADGLWLTARHVVDECDSIWMIRQGERLQESDQVQKSVLHPGADVALLFHRLNPPRAPVVTRDYRPQRNAAGFHFGYPGGDPGDVLSAYMGDSTATIRGARSETFPIQVWAAREIPSHLTSLGGLSGGPALDAQGRIVGVTIAESPRRGRVATTPPQLSNEMIDLADVEAQFAAGAAAAVPVGGLTPESYQRRGDALRADLSVTQIYCHVRLPGRSSPLDRF